jgi:hypothetical protein
MSDNSNFGFGKFVPGFDFLQNLTQGAAQKLPQMPNLSSWVAPTLSVEELEKRISELKAVHFWLEQNSKMLGATIQALEVQKMTLATLQGMNFKMADLANALKLKPTGAPAAEARKPAEAKPAEPAPEAAAARLEEGAEAPAGKAAIDPLAWWGSLTQQFQQIAASTMKDVAEKASAEAARSMANGAAARDAMKAAGAMVKAASSAAAAPAKKRPARKAAARKAPARKRAPRTAAKSA